LDKKNGDIWFTKLNYFYKILDNIKLKVEEESEKAEENEDITIPDVIINKIFNANIQKIHRYLSELKYRHIWDKEVRVDFDENESIAWVQNTIVF
jgi:glutaredoxin